MRLRSILQEASVWRAARAAFVRLMVLSLVVQGLVAVRHIHADASDLQSALTETYWADHHEGPDGSPGHDRHKNQKSEKNCPACLAASMGAYALLDVAMPSLPAPQRLNQADGHRAIPHDPVARLASPIRAPPFPMNA